MVTEPGAWVWYQARWFWNDNPPSQRNGTSYSVASEPQVAVVVKRATFGFASEPLGECSWTARDLT